MSEFETISEMIPVNPPSQNDPCTYYAGKSTTPDFPHYLLQYKTEKNTLSWATVLVISLICALLGGTTGACSVLLIQNLQTEDSPETDVSYIMQSIRENQPS